MFNYHCGNYLPYDDIVKRIYYKRFCYISDDLDNFEDFILDNDDENFKPVSTIINKFVYAIKLIENGWTMDNYLLKDKSWTINFWNNYKLYLNIIKFKNDCELDNKCFYCKKTFIDIDKVFNKSDIYVHYNCLFSKLYT